MGLGIPPGYDSGVSGEASQDLRIVWVGYHIEGLPTLEELIRRGLLVGAVTLEPEAMSRRSGAADIAGICRQSAIPLLEVTKVNDDETVDFIAGLQPDLIVALGWGQIFGPRVLRIPRIGVLGAHASPLPHNRGAAPVQWAIIRGETEGGNTLMWLSDVLDGGAIAAQRLFPILATDTCASVYDKVAQTNLEMVLEVLEAAQHGHVLRRPQPSSPEPLLPRRRPSDGLIDWAQPAHRVYNFIRALTRPYPGAFTPRGDSKLLVWEAALLPVGVVPDVAAGTVLGKVISPNPQATGIVVACDPGAIFITQAELDGQCLSGAAELCAILPEGVGLA